ncbi:MAG: hypothetical protein WA945_07760 [Arcobacteraceae bacterium]
MKRLLTSALVLMTIIGLNGCSEKTPEQSPIRVEAKTLTNDWGGYTLSVPVVEVIAVTDEVTIEDVIANNGNCKMTAITQRSFPTTLYYGHKVKAGYTSKCNLIKVEVITNKGNWIVEFE